MVTTSAVVLCLLLGVLAVFQLLLAFGAPLARFAWGGQHRVLPMALRLGSVLSIVIYAVVAAVVAARADLISLNVPDSVIDVTAWVATGYFSVGILLNLASRSKPERIVMTPLCAVLGILCGVVAMG